VARLSDRRMHPQKILFLLDAESTQSIKSVRNINDPIGNRTRDVPAFSAEPKRTAPPHIQEAYLNTFRVSVT
jgi:hypothetical protein